MSARLVQCPSLMELIVITNACIGTCDTACVYVCPVDAIHGPHALDKLEAMSSQERAESGTQLFIDPEACICCRACIPECPVTAIVEDDDPGGSEGLAAAREFFTSRDAAMT